VLVRCMYVPRAMLAEGVSHQPVVFHCSRIPLPRVQYHPHNRRRAAGMPMPEIIRVGHDASRSGLGGAGRGIHMYCLMRQDPVR
jgi:hypothetical protein